MPRALASLTLSFGLVSIPVRLYNATEPAPGVRFRLLTPTGERVRQQYVAESAAPIEEPVPAAPLGEPATADFGAPAVTPLLGRPGSEAAIAASRTVRAREAARQVATAVEGVRAATAPAAQPASPAAAASRAPPRDARADEALDAAHEEASAFAEPAPVAARPAVARDRLLKGYEFEKGRYVTFTPEELAALAPERRDTIDVVAFVAAHDVDPTYYDKAYFLAPERRGAKPYALLLEALRHSGRSAIAKWAWRGKETVVEIRPTAGGLVLQQLRYADEVRSLDDLRIELEPVRREELALALQLVEQNAERWDPARWVNEEKARVQAAIERKVAGERIVEPEPPRAGTGAQVIDLMEALRASLRRGLDERGDRTVQERRGLTGPPPPTDVAGARKPPRRRTATPAAAGPAAAPKGAPGAKRRSRP